MRINRDKLNKLAHTVADTLAETDEVGFLEDRNTIRQEARKALEQLLTEEAKIDTAARLKIANQRKIIAETINPDVTRVPQVWCLYKEVQTYYEQGMRVPDNVTLLWSDDNWGDIRRLPTPEERKRPGARGGGLSRRRVQHSGHRS